MACILLCSSAVGVHDSQVYRKMDVTRERHQLYLGGERNTLCQSKLVSALSMLAVVCAICDGVHGDAKLQNSFVWQIYD